MELSPEGLRNQRKSPAVLKVDLARIRERSPCLMVIVLEGKEDLPVYETWIRRASSSLSWEPLVAHGKRNLLNFLAIIRRDKTGIGKCTYFIVDHDYDGMGAEDPGEEIYVLPAYSMENFLTCTDVFDSFLRTDLHVLGEMDLRRELVERFSRLEMEFVNLMRPACAKLYAARSEPVGNVSVSESISLFVDIRLDNVVAVEGKDVSALVSSEVAVSEAGLRSGYAFLSGGDVRLWVRGKFMLLFFKKICELFYEDRRSPSPRFFAETGRGLNFTPASLDLRNLAAKSPLPERFAETIDRWSTMCNCS